MLVKVSVIICCYNSESRILPTLEHLSNQKFEGNWELIIVDNNCTDKTTELVLTSWPRLTGVPLKIVKEEMPGLSFARKSGVENASSDLIVFCDDDNWLDSSYLQNAVSIMSSDTSIGALGGWSKPAFDDNIVIPDWFEKAKSGYAVGMQAAGSGDVTDRGYLWGAGLVLRRSLYQVITHVQFPLFLTDRKGAQLSSGGDSEICLRLIIIGYKLRYAEQLFYYHYIPSARLIDVYKDNLFKSFEESGKIFDKYSFFIRHYVNNKKRFFYYLKWNVKYWLMVMKIVKRIDSLVQDRMLSIYTKYKFTGLDEELRLLFKLSKCSESKLK